MENICSEVPYRVLHGKTAAVDQRLACTWQRHTLGGQHSSVLSLHIELGLMEFLTVRSVYGAVLGECQKGMRVNRAEMMTLLDVSVAPLGAGNRG